MDEFSKGGKYFDLYQQMYQFHKRHHNAKTDADWERVINDLGQLTKRYDNDELVTEILAAIVNEIERRNDVK